MRRGGSVERRSVRHRLYSFLGFLAVTVIGVVALFMLRGVGKRHVGKLYHSPERALYEVFGSHETLFKHRNGRYATLRELVRDEGLSDELLEGPIEGFTYAVPIATVGSYVVTADQTGPDPVHPGKDPVRRYRHFRMDETQCVRGEEARPAGPDSPIIYSARDAVFR